VHFKELLEEIVGLHIQIAAFHLRLDPPTQSALLKMVLQVPLRPAPV
jgi:hypothetical protein